MTYNFRRLIINVGIILSLISLLVGCSQTDTNFNQSSTKKSATITTSSPANEKPLNNSEKGDSLASWVGDYIFSEYAPPNQNMLYHISLYKENSNYYANIIIDGFQTMDRLQAKVTGDENAIKLVFYMYLPDNLWESYKEGDILLSFEKRNSVLYTSWGKIQPMLKSNSKSGLEYFEFNSLKKEEGAR